MTQVTYQNYCHLAPRTESPIADVLARVNKRPERFLRLVHSATGLDSETEELLESYMKKDYVNTFGELGDLFWFVNIGYLALGNRVNYEEFLNVETSEFDGLNTPNLIENLDCKIAEFQDHIKAHLFYGREEFKLGHDVKPSATVVLVADINAIAFVLVQICKRIIDEFRAETAIAGNEYTGPKTVQDILAANIAKLRARYPDAYSDIAANERDDGKERAAIANATS